MKKALRQPDGKYHVKGKKYEMLVGSRAQVQHDTAYKTPGGLTKDNLIINKNGRIVSKKKHLTSKKENGKRFKDKGYNLSKKGKFGPVKRKTRKRKVKK